MLVPKNVYVYIYIYIESQFGANHCNIDVYSNHYTIAIKSQNVQVLRVTSVSPSP